MEIANNDCIFCFYLENGLVPVGSDSRHGYGFQGQLAYHGFERCFVSVGEASTNACVGPDGCTEHGGYCSEPPPCLRFVTEIMGLNTRKAVAGSGDIKRFLSRALPLSGQ